MKDDKSNSSLAMKFLSLAGLGSFGFPGIIISLIIPGILSIYIPYDYRLVLLLTLSLALFLIAIKLIKSIDGEIDKGYILIDKMIAFLLVLSLCPFTDEWIWMIIAVLVFFIILQMKLFPYRYISGKAGLAGIFGDDMIVGFYAILTIHLFYYAFQVIGLIKILGMKY